MKKTLLDELALSLTDKSLDCLLGMNFHNKEYKEKLRIEAEVRYEYAAAMLKARTKILLDTLTEQSEELKLNDDQ